MKRYICITAVLCLAVMTMAQTYTLPRTTPERQGLESKYVKEFFDSVMSAKNTIIHSCVVMRHGNVIGEIYPKPWKKEYAHTMYSASKTFTAAAIGILLDEGLIDLDEPIDKYFALTLDDEYSDNLKQITIRHLLTMESGIPVDTRMRQVETDWLHFYLNRPLSAEPGTLFAYDSISTYMLSVIVQQVTGETLHDFLRKRMFAPMFMSEAAWEESPNGVSCGGWGLYIKPESMAKFGQLMLKHGRWNGTQIIPRDWTTQMMSPQSTTGRYGYQMWMCDYDGWAQANGAYGQLIFIIPEADMVVTFTQCNTKTPPLQRWIKKLLVDNCKNHQIRIKNVVVTRTITKGKTRKVIKTVLPSDADKLKMAQTEYSLPTLKGSAGSLKHGRTPVTLSFADNSLKWETATIRFDQKLIYVTVTETDGNTFTLRLPFEKWQENEFLGYPYCPRPFLGQFSNLPKSWHVSGCYAWSDDNTLRMRLHWTDWLSSADVTIKFSGATATLFFKPSETTKTMGFKAWVK